MINITVRLAESDADLERMSTVLLELRGHLEKSELISRIRLQQESGYEVAFAESDGEVVGVAGFVIGHKLAWGKHMYIDDLVTSEKRRSEGVGSQLLAWLKAYATTHDCAQVHLDSGVQRFAAHRFYLRHGFDIASHYFSMLELDSPQRGSA
ncbi:MAG TPA: GNAT family N-acetyltransferase [Dokdonella sp.]|uniref:GNAT family N-acetyltransferase n=1 Tax=Dokdonella sp. TaxID=2291710 RepID=UPI002D804DC5|nr:GNAT family N-acetyltransferase [Dokdonella sp.]HET9032070.1 GNAT family N-acetyltransferase [Dokdonella sp.]